MVSTIGTANASVLPDPVGDLTSTSRPWRTSGMTISCTGKGSWIPPSARASTTALDAPRPAKAWEDICDSFAGGHSGRLGDSGDSTDPDRLERTRQEPRGGNVPPAWGTLAGLPA